MKNKPLEESTEETWDEEEREAELTPHVEDELKPEDENDASERSEEETSEVTEVEKQPKRWNKVKALKERSRELEQQNAELLRALQQREQEFARVNDQNIYNYGHNTLGQLKNAEALYKQALQQGTVEDITTATANYNVALNDYREAERTITAFQQEREIAQYKGEDNAAQAQREEAKQLAEKERLANQWLAENPDLDKGSQYYNPKLEELVINVVEKINKELAIRNQEYKVGTREYFDTIDEYVDFYKNQSPSNLKGYSVNIKNKVSANTGHRTITLTPHEAQIANGLGMTAKEYKELQAAMPEKYKMKR